MGFAIGLLLGFVSGICCTALCVSGKSKNVFTNADRIALDTNGLADMIYRSDDINPDICSMHLDGDDNPVGCNHPDDEGAEGCIKCIKEWLNKEVETE